MGGERKRGEEGEGGKKSVCVFVSIRRCFLWFCMVLSMYFMVFDSFL